MANIQSLRKLYDQSQRPDSASALVLPSSVSPRASSGLPYESASTSRRMATFVPTRLGPTTSLTMTLDMMRARCRDEIRNNPYAASACDSFEAHTIGEGIFPHWNLDNKDLKQEIEEKFDLWARRTQFYVKQSTAAREIFEGGEVFCRLLPRPSSWGLAVPLDIQLIEGEQCPVFFNSFSGGASAATIPQGHSVKTGIEFDPYGRIVAYHMYRQHPGETMLYPMDGLSYMRVPADEIIHAFKPLRAGLLRGVPHLSSVLTLLHEIGKYTDAAVVAKSIQTMFAGFIEKVDLAADLLPPDTTSTPSDSLNPPQTPSFSDPGIDQSRIEPGTMQVLFPGEKVTFPTLPQNTDMETFLSVCLHQFAAGIGSTYETITGDLRQVNLSAIRYGIQVMQRKIAQFQRFVLILQLFQPIVRRFLIDAQLSGELILPFFARKPWIYENISWRVPGAIYMDPMVDYAAANGRVRSGFSSREDEAAALGNDAMTIDKQQVADNARADALGLVYDSDGRKILPKGTKLTALGEEDAGGVAGVKPKDSETPSETAKLAPPPAPVAAPKPKPNGRA